MATSLSSTSRKASETARAFLAQAGQQGVDHICCGDHVSFLAGLFAETAILRRLGDGPAVTPGSFGWTKASLRFDGDTAIANIQFLPEGRVNGVVVNDQGVPIGAKVRLTGPGLDGIGQPTTLRLGDVTSDPATGLFAFGRLPQGAWALQAASPFYPVVVMTNGNKHAVKESTANILVELAI